MKYESLLVFNQTIRYRIRVSERAQRLRVAVYADGDVVVTKPKTTSMELLGRFIEIKKLWIYKKLEDADVPPIQALRESSMNHFSSNRDSALKLVNAKLSKWNAYYGYEFEKVEVKQFKSRWGSCSSKNTLSFNYKILFLPENAQDYVIVHELCHLKERNHSRKFWGLVAKAIPDYQELNKLIRRI